VKQAPQTTTLTNVQDKKFFEPDEIKESFKQNILTIDIDENIEIKLQEKKLQ